MWVYSITKRILTDGKRTIYVYAGNGIHKDNPSSCDVKGHGPLPLGFYTIRPAYDHPKLGPVVMFLEPDKTNDMHGRSAFFIHGDSKRNPGEASDGCICTRYPSGKKEREYINTSTDKRLQVTI